MDAARRLRRRDGEGHFYGLGLSKADFVASAAFTLLIYKMVQFVAWYGLLTSALAATSLLLTGIALAGFVAGLWIQNRLDRRAFNRAVLALLGALGVWLVVRSVLA